MKETNNEKNTGGMPWQPFFLLFMGVFLIRNLLLPMVSDDIPYAFIWDGADRGNLLDGVGVRERVTSFWDILDSQYSHYMTWGGRVLGIGLTQLFAWEGKHLFDFLNTAVFAALALLVFRIATGDGVKSLNKTYVLWILMAFWFLLPDPFLTTLWMCGSCVYLWMALLEFAFLLPYALKYWHEDFWVKPPFWSVPLMALSGLAAGWSVETGAAAAAFIAFFAVIYFYREKKLQSWMVAGFVFICAGALLLTQAPGEVVRMELQREYEYNPALPADMYWTPLMFAITFQECFWPVVKLWIPLLLPIGYYVHKLPRGGRLNKVVKFQTVMIAGALSVMIVMLFVPMAPARAGFFSAVAVIVASVSAIKELMPEIRNFYREHRKITGGICAVAGVLWIATAGFFLYVEGQLREDWLARIEYINARKDQDLVVVHQIDVSPLADAVCDWWGCVTWSTEVLAWGSDLEPREEGSHNIMYAQYYGWKKVITDGEDRRMP